MPLKSTTDPFYSRLLKRLIRGVAIVLLLLLAACVLPPAEADKLKSSVTFTRQELPRTSVFLTLQPEFAPQIRVDLSALDILVDGIWLPLLNGPIQLDARQIGGSQIHLGGSSLPVGRSNLLRMQFSQIWTVDSAGDWQPRLDKGVDIDIPLTTALELDSDDSKSLFINWDAAKTMESTATLRGFSAGPASGELPIDVLYVSCPDINTVFIVRTDHNRVIDSFGVDGSPGQLALDGEHLYVLAADKREIQLIELSSYRVLDRFSYPLNDDPDVMVLGKGGRTAYLLDRQGGYLSRVDLVTGGLLARVSLGYQPGDLIHLENPDLLVVSLGLSQRVLLLDPDNLRTLTTLSTGGNPFGVAVLDRLLYVAEEQSNTVSVFDLQRGALLERLMVGFGPQHLLVDRDQIYISHPRDGTLSILVPGQLGVSREVSNLGYPGDMAHSNRFRHLYVIDALRGGLSAIDTNSNFLSARIPLGAVPAHLVVTP